MTHIQPTYYALLEDEKTVIYKSSIELIHAIQEPIKYIIKTAFDSHIKWGMNEANLFTYTSVDINGNPKPIELPNFTIVDLGTDWPGKYTNQRIITIKERHTGIIKDFPSNAGGKYFLTTDLMPLIRELNNAGSWETLKKYKELEEVKKENDRLKKHLEQLKSEIELLKKFAPANNQ